ncbi:hypothetical protein CQW23_32993 [Capsicum baccatum]|uniref:Uncharacterized protein n=1 Tax=Capsicum baccatum TaxID=33114 RepID=A0A2G2V370_CAPBA|nr:hypothetical protein CQW23_32993 [Capsicum baccatum]
MNVGCHAPPDLFSARNKGNFDGEKNKNETDICIRIDLLALHSLIGRLSKEQVQVYINEESNRRKNLLEKYIRLCNDAKVPVDTMLVESNSPAKALLDLIPVVKITSLVIGTRLSRSTRRVRKGQYKGEYVQENAPEFCEVKVVGEVQQPKESFSRRQPEIPRHSDRNFLECICFSRKFY